MYSVKIFQPGELLTLIFFQLLVTMHGHHSQKNLITLQSLFICIFVLKKNSVSV